MDGLALLREIRAIDPQASVIMLTGAGTETVEKPGVTTKRQSKRTGWALATVYGIVTQSGDAGKENDGNYPHGR